MDANADAKQPMVRVDMLQQLVLMEVVVEIGVRALEVEYEAFEVCVAIRHQLNSLLFGLETIASLDHHT